MLQILNHIWGETGINRNDFRGLTIEETPVFNETILKIHGIDIERMSAEEQESIMPVFANAFRSLDHKQNYRIIVLNRPGKAVVTPPQHTKRKEFLERYQEYLNNNINVRKRSVYMLFEKDNNVSEMLHSSGLNVSTARGEFLNDMEYFLGNYNGDFQYPVEPWKYGVKIGPLWGVTLMHLSAVEYVEPFSHHVLNYLPDDFIFCMSFNYPTLYEIERKINRLLKVYQQKESHAAKEVEQELLEIIKKLSLGREVMLYVTSTLTIFARSQQDAINRAKAVSVLLKNSGLNYVIEGTVEPKAFSYLFGYDVESAKTLSLARKYPLSTFIRLLPFGKNFQGVSSGELYFNSSMEAVYVDTYKAASMHCTTLGHTGAGKSMLAQYRDLYTDLLVVIEKIQEDEGSYRYSVPYFGGKYAPLTLERPLSLNAFGTSIEVVDVPSFLEAIGFHYSDFSEKEIITLKDIFEFNFSDRSEITRDELIDTINAIKSEGIEFLVYKLSQFDWKWSIKKTIDRQKLSNTVTILASMLGSSSNLSPEDMSILEKAALYAYKDKKDEKQHLLVSHVVEKLFSLGHRAQAERLRSFTLEGRFGLLFDAPPDIEGETNIYYELRVNDNEVLIPAILSILIHTLKTFSHPVYAGMRKKVRLDEAWFFIAHPLLKNFVNEMIRTYRKKGIELDFDSQMASDFTSGEAAVISSQCEHNFFLFNKAEALPIIKDYFMLKDSDVQHMSQIKPPVEYGYKYSKFFLRATYGKGVLTYIPSPELYWLATTRPADKVKREKAKAQYKDLDIAIRELANA